MCVTRDFLIEITVLLVHNKNFIMRNIFIVNYEKQQIFSLLTYSVQMTYKLEMFECFGKVRYRKGNLDESKALTDPYKKKTDCK